MLTSSQLELELKALKPILYRDFSVTKIGVFGSFSDNTYTEDYKQLTLDFHGVEL